MKIKTLKALLFLLLSSSVVFATDVVLHDFESGSPATAAKWGASYANVSNPVSSGINTTAMCGKIGRTSANFYEAIEFNTANSYLIPEGEKRYIQIMVNCTYQAVVKIQVNKVQPYYTALYSYSANGTWQELVYEITGATGGTTITSLYVMGDIGTGVNGTGVLDNSTKFLYIDEIIATDKPKYRGTATITKTNLLDFESNSETSSTATLVTQNADYITNLSYANPTSTVNPTSNCAYFNRNTVSTLIWWHGLQFDFPTAIDAGENQYLHVMMKKSATEIQKVQISLYNTFGAQTSALMDAAITTNWVDYVVPIPPTHRVFNKLYIKFNAATTATECFADEILISNSSTPRTGISPIVVKAANKNISNYLTSETSNLIVDAIGELVVNQNASLNNITLNAGGKITNTNGNTLTLENLVIESDANGNGTLVETGSTTTVTGTTTVKQYLAASRNWYFTPAIAGAVVPSGANYFGYDEKGENTDLSVSGATAYWKPYTASSSLTPGKGYIVKPGSATTLSFEGALNSGEILAAVTRTTTASKLGFNLLANPYPSYLNWEQVLNLNANNASLLQPSIWYRTATYNEALSKFDYSFNTYNSVARVASPTSTSGYIPPMQAFWVRANGNGNATFTNDMRSHGNGESNKLKAPAINTQKIMRLQVANEQGVTDETVIFFNANALNTYDAYDSPKMFSNSIQKPEIFSKVGDEQLVINGLNELAPNASVALGFVTGKAGSFSITSSEMSNFETGTRVVLLDKLNPTNEIELTQGVAYNFESQVTSLNNERFSVQFRMPGISTSMVNSVNDRAKVFLSTNNEIVILSLSASDYVVHNTLGMPMQIGKTQINQETKTPQLSAGVYVVKVNNQSTKIIVN